MTDQLTRIADALDWIVKLQIQQNSQIKRLADRLAPEPVPERGPVVRARVVSATFDHPSAADGIYPDE